MFVYIIVLLMSGPPRRYNTLDSWQVAKKVYKVL